MKKYYPALIVLDFVWAVSALIYDWPAIQLIPVLLLPFIMICPIYPALLAVIWNRESKKIAQNDFLLAFTLLPSIIYTFAALIYYPAWMAQNGFDWPAFGQIFWVLFYGLQAMYLYLNKPVLKLPKILAGIFILLSFFLQYTSNTYGYLDFVSINHRFLFFSYVALSIIVIFIAFYSPKHVSKGKH